MWASLAGGGVLLVAGAVAAGYFLWPTSKSDEELIDAAGRDLVVALVARDFPTMERLTCKEKLAWVAEVRSNAETETADSEAKPPEVSVADIKLSGDTATAQLTVREYVLRPDGGGFADEPLTSTKEIPFKKEDGDWKVCPSE